jgi:hypothetical protein
MEHEDKNSCAKPNKHSASAVCEALDEGLGESLSDSDNDERQ